MDSKTPCLLLPGLAACLPIYQPTHPIHTHAHLLLLLLLCLPDAHAGLGRAVRRAQVGKHDGGRHTHEPKEGGRSRAFLNLRGRDDGVSHGSALSCCSVVRWVVVEAVRGWVKWRRRRTTNQGAGLGYTRRAGGPRVNPIHTRPAAPPPLDCPRGDRRGGGGVKVGVPVDGLTINDRGG